MNNINKEWLCDSCSNEVYTLYEGWFYTNQRLNPFAVGTASAGLMQYKRVCRQCLQHAIDNKLTECKEIPS